MQKDLSIDKDSAVPPPADMKSRRARAAEHIERGAVTPGYGVDRQIAIRLLNEALATELVCVLRYRRHHFMASGINASAIAAEFLEHSNEEQRHADRLAARITQIGGAPNFNPEGLTTRSHAEYVEGETIAEMLREDLIAERIAIDSYRELVAFFGQGDSTTRTMLESILASEEEHADDLSTLMENLPR